MLKKILLAGAVIVAGSSMTSQPADAYQVQLGGYGAQVIGGPVVRVYRPYVGSSYRYGYPSYRSSYPSYRYNYPSYRYGYQSSYRYGRPGYRSYRAPIGPGGYGYPYYGRSAYPYYGVPGRTSGFSLNIGPSWRGW